MELNEVFTLWDRFERSKVTEFAFETKDGKVSFKKDGAAGPAALPAAAPAQEAAAETGAAKNTPPDRADESGVVVKAQFVGTFYVASAPGAEPYVRIGRKVKKDDVIGLIDAMKMMNEIVSPVDGTVTDIYVGDETLVEYGQDLVRIGV